VKTVMNLQVSKKAVNFSLPVELLPAQEELNSMDWF
jgi:hypothetical protein